MASSVTKFARQVAAFLGECEAAAATEYVVLLAAMTVTVVAAVTYFGVDMAGTVSLASEEVAGTPVGSQGAPAAAVFAKVVVSSNAAGVTP